jgi:hypothetical protein
MRFMCDRQNQINWCFIEIEDFQLPKGASIYQATNTE